MTAGKQQVDLDKLRMREGDFDAIMRKALQVKPEDGKPKNRAGSKPKKKQKR